jgi:Restriction endonuclease
VTETDQEDWEIYEQVAGELLERLGPSFGLDFAEVEDKQDCRGDSGTDWEIDRVGITNDGRKVVSIECRQLSTTVKQNDIAAVAYIRDDIHAEGAVLVTTKGVQAGGITLAEYEDIMIIHLNRDATTKDFTLESMGKKVVGQTMRISGHGQLEATAVPNPQPSS